MPEAPVEVEPDATDVPVETDLGDAGKKAIAAERSRADKAEKALKALQQAEQTRANAELSELERIKQENANLLTEKSTAALEATRLRVALEKGIPANLAGRLQGADYDEISADADSLSELLSTKGTGPRPDPSQGPKAVVGKQTPGQEFASFINQQIGK